MQTEWLIWPVKTCLFFIGFVGACALSLVYPIVGIVNYILVYLINPHEMWWGQPLEPWGIRYSMTAAVCLILGMILSAGRVPRNQAIFGGWALLLFSFTGIVLCSGHLGVGTTAYGMALMEKMVKMSIFLVCLLRMATTRKYFRIVLWSLVIGTMVIGYDAYNAPEDDFFSGRLSFVGGADFRDSSGLAAHMAAMLPLVGVVVMTTPSWRWKALATVAGVLAVNTIVQCRTRSAFMGLLVGVAVALLLAPRVRRWRVYLALAVGALGAYALTDAPFWKRMKTVMQSDRYRSDAAIQSRFELWIVAGDMLADHPFGVGVGQFLERMGDYRTGEEIHAFDYRRRVTHNTYLLCMTELGAQGLAVLAALILLSVYKLYRCARIARTGVKAGEARLLAYGCLLSISIYLGAGAFTDRLYTESFWWVLALPVCLEASLRREAMACQMTLEPIGPIERWSEAHDDDDLPLGSPDCAPRGAFG